MENVVGSISLYETFNAVIETGRNWKPFVSELRGRGKPAPKHVTTWQEEFNLSAWKDWTYELVVWKNEMIDDKKTQEISVRGIFKKSSVLGSGHNSIVALAVIFVRNMPIEIEAFKEQPSPFKKFDGMPWKITDLHYYLSPGEIFVPVVVDMLRKRD